MTTPKKPIATGSYRGESDPYMELVAAYRLVDTDTRWMDNAKCNMDDGITWFADVGQSKLVAEAKAFCQNCPVQKRCLEWALNNEIPCGVWGGQSAHQRWKSLHGRNRWGKVKP